MNHQFVFEGVLISLVKTEFPEKQDGSEPRAYLSAEVSAVLPGARRPLQCSISLNMDEVPETILQKMDSGEFMYRPVKINITSIGVRKANYANGQPRLVVTGTMVELDGKPIAFWNNAPKAAVKEPVKSNE